MFVYFEVELICSVLLVSGVQRGDSVVHTYFTFFSILGYYNIVSVVPCAVQWDLAGHLLYIQYVLILSFSSSVVDEQCRVSGAQRHDSVIHGYAFFSFVGYCKVLTAAPRAVQRGLAVYLVYTQWCVC